MSHDVHQAFFDLLASEWDLMFTTEDLEFLRYIVGKLAVEEGMDIIDLGCGTGILFDMLRRRVGDRGSVTGVDFSMQMVLKACRNFPFPNVNVVDADATMLPFADSSFDMAVAFSAFPHFSDQQKAIGATNRILRPGARFYIIHLQSSKELSEIHQQVGGVIEHDLLPPPTRLREMLNAGRFTDIIIDDHPGLYLASAVNSK